MLTSGRFNALWTTFLVRIVQCNTSTLSWKHTTAPYQLNLPVDLEFWDNPPGHVLWRRASRSLLHNLSSVSATGPLWDLWRKIPVKHADLLTAVKPSNSRTAVKQADTSFPLALYTQDITVIVWHNRTDVRRAFLLYMPRHSFVHYVCSWKYNSKNKYL